MVGLVVLVGVLVAGWYGAVEMGYLARPWGKYDCPVKGKYCRKAKVVNLGGEYFGLGFSVPAGEEYRAVVDSIRLIGGTMSVGQSVEEEERFFLETLMGRDTSVTYLVNDKVRQRENNVRKGEVIGRVPKERLGYFVPAYS